MSKCEKKSESAAAKNRAEHPETAKCVDLFRKHFGDGVKVVCSTLDGRLIGVLQTAPKRFVTAERWLWQTKNLVEPELLRRAAKPMLPNHVGGKRK